MASSAGTGNRNPPKGVDTRPERLQVAWEKHPEGNPVDRMPGPHASKHARNVLGLLLVQEVTFQLAPLLGHDLH